MKSVFTQPLGEYFARFVHVSRFVLCRVYPVLSVLHALQRLGEGVVVPHGGKDAILQLGIRHLKFVRSAEESWSKRWVLGCVSNTPRQEEAKVLESPDHIL